MEEKEIYFSWEVFDRVVNFFVLVLVKLNFNWCVKYFLKGFCNSGFNSVFGGGLYIYFGDSYGWWCSCFLLLVYFNGCLD